MMAIGKTSVSGGKVSIHNIEAIPQAQIGSAMEIVRMIGDSTQFLEKEICGLESDFGAILISPMPCTGEDPIASHGSPAQTALLLLKARIDMLTRIVADIRSRSTIGAA